jgi:hypothetical protein
MYHGWLSAARSLVVHFKTVGLVMINHTEAPICLQDLSVCWRVIFSAGGKMFQKLLRRYFLTSNELPVSFTHSRNAPQVVYIQEKFFVCRCRLWNYKQNAHFSLYEPWKYVRGVKGTAPGILNPSISWSELSAWSSGCLTPPILIE